MATVTLDPSDLRLEFQRREGGAAVDQAIPTHEVTFDKLNDAAQKLVRIAGNVIFYSWDRQTHEMIYAPK